MIDIPVKKPVRRVGIHRRGEPHPDLFLNDFILTEGQEFMGDLIGFGQRRKMKGEDAKYTKVSHFAWSLGAEELSEALLKGVQKTDLSRYDDFNYVYVNMNNTHEAHWQNAIFLQDVLNKRTKYGFKTIANIFFTYTTGWGWIAPDENTAICSGYGAEGVVRLRPDVVYDTSLFKVSPADHLKYVLDKRHTISIDDRIWEWMNEI